MNADVACPTCGGPVDGLITEGPGEHVIDPCGHRATLSVRQAMLDPVVADGGETLVVDLDELTAFTVRYAAGGGVGR